MKKWQKFCCYAGLALLVFVEFFLWVIYYNFVLLNSLGYRSAHLGQPADSDRFAIDVLTNTMWFNLVLVIVFAVALIRIKAKEGE